MRNHSHIGKRKIGFVTFFLCVIVTIFIFCLHYGISSYEGEKSHSVEHVPNQNNKILTDENNINVSLQRYYSSLPLLADDKNEREYQVNELNKDYISYEVQLDQIVDASEKLIVADSDDSLQNESVSLDTSSSIGSPSSTEVEGLSRIEPSVDEEEPVIEAVEQPAEEQPIDLFAEDDGWDDWGDDWDDLPELLPPTLFDPMIQTQEEYDMFNPVVTEVAVYTDDFFADFYVAGEDDTALYPDGYYYLALTVNEDTLGEIEVRFDEGSYYLNAQELINFISNRLSDEALDRIFGDNAEYISIDDLVNKGVDASVNVEDFAVYLNFSLDDMPLIVIPVAEVDKSSKIQKNNQYGISDAEQVDSEFISAVSSINLYSSYSYGPIYTSANSLTLNLYMSNSVSAGEIEFDFSNSFAYTFGDTNPLSYDFGSWSGTHTFRKQSLQLTFGQVGGSLISDGTPIGFTLEKSYSYGDDSALPHQFQRSYIIKDLATINIFLNGEIILSKRVKEGEYKFIDFAFKNGANKIIFDINYDDEQYDDIKEEYSIAYDSSLLARGDYLWGLSGAIHKTEVDDVASSLFALPYPDGNWYEYNFDEFEMKYWINMGLTDEFTLKTSLSMSSYLLDISMDGILATMHGSYTGSFELYLEEDLTPSVDFSVSHTYGSSIGDISASLSLSLPEFEYSTMDLSTDGSIGLSLGYTIDLWQLPSINTSLSLTAANSRFSASSSLSTTVTPFTGLSLSSSLSFAASYDSDPSFSLSISLTYSLLENLTTSTSLSSSGDSSISSRLKASDNDSLQFSLSNINYFEDTDPTYSGTWSHSGDVSTLSVKQTASDDFTDFNTNASLSTNIYYAGGLFGISTSSSSNFLLLKTTGKLSGSPISVSKTNDSSPKQLTSLFGTSVYTDLTANSKNNLIIYSETDSVYSSGGTFSYELNTLSRTGFTKVLSIPTSYTVSGVLYNTDGLPYAQYSSPVYTREVDENGNYYLQISESQYLFADANGRWILNDVSPGIYVFDLQVGNDWYALSFDIPDDEENDGKVIEIEDYQAEEAQPELISWDVDLEAEEASTEEDDILVDTFGNEIVAEYAKVVLLNIARVTDEETFAQTSSQEFAPTGFEQTISTDDDSTEEEFDPFADTASSWDDSEYDEWTF